MAVHIKQTDLQSPRFTDIIKMSSNDKYGNNAAQIFRTHEQQPRIRTITMLSGGGQSHLESPGPVHPVADFQGTAANRNRSARSRKSTKSGKSYHGTASKKSGAKKKKSGKSGGGEG